MTTAAETKEQDIVITRTFDAPRELVWKAWTDCEHLKKWWGPKDFTSPTCKMDVRVGGTYLWSMRGPDGKEYYSTGEFREVVPPERLALTDSFADAEGKKISAAEYGLPGEWPENVLITVTLENQAGKTKMTVRQSGIPGGKLKEMTNAGWNESFDKLAAALNNTKGRD